MEVTDDWTVSRNCDIEGSGVATVFSTFASPPTRSERVRRTPSHHQARCRHCIVDMVALEPGNPERWSVGEVPRLSFLV